MKKYFLYSFIVFSVFSGIAFCEEPVQSPEQTKKEEPKEELTETTHAIKINGEEIHYKASAGTLLLKDEKGDSKATIFYIAYTKEGEKNPKNRPVTFCFNGGPGSSAIWLHLGVLGPKRINLTEEGYSLPPYELLPNEYSLLDETDLVFIDPVSTGYSRAVPGEDPKQFHGVDEDIQSVAEFIRLYVTRNNRWGSSKFLVGESYGTIRAAGLANHLHEQHKMSLNGVILVSTVLNYQTKKDNQKGNDLPYILYLPSYAATAWYHGKLPQDLQKKQLMEVLAEVEHFAANEYSLALFKGSSLTGSERSRITQKYSRYTGLKPDYIQRANFRVPVLRYCKEILRDDERVVGRFDGRIKGIDSDACGECMENDPSGDAIFNGFTAAFNQYVRMELEWEKDDPYKVLTRDVRPWNFGKSSNEYLNVAESLRNVMSRNPQLKVFVASGYYDLATPYFATNYTLNHMGLDPALAENVTREYYYGGHMMYTHQPSLKKMKEDLVKFYRDTVNH